MSVRHSPNKSLTRREILKYGLYGSLAPGLWLSGCRKNGVEKRPNVVLITLDTTRADHLGCYGYHRQTSPNIDKVAQGSLVYNRAIAPSSWTLPSHASLFTGKFTSSHGAQYDPDGPLRLTDAIRGPSEWPEYRARGLAQNEMTLAGILKERGYVTGAVVGGPWMKRHFGLDKGFDYYNDSEISTFQGRLASQVTGNALKWLKQLQNKRYFLFLNYFDPHGPYLPPEDFARAFLPKDTDLSGNKTLSGEEYKSLYDAEILYMDHYLGRLLKKLKDCNSYDNTLLIITADHGELFGEHGKFYHGKYLYQEELHIPLLVKYPGTEVAPNRTDVTVQLNDVFAIILERLGIGIPPDIQAGIPPDIGHPVLAETYPLKAVSREGHWRAIFENNLKFVWSSKERHMLFHLGDDPTESVNLAPKRPDQVLELLSKMNRYIAQLPKPGPTGPVQQLDESTKKALESLGYVDQLKL